jgi:hypothetical protein
MKTRKSAGLFVAVLLLSDIELIPVGHAEEAPRAELGCQIRQADGYPLDTADLTFQQRLSIARCINASARTKQAELMRLRNERQTIENIKNARRAEENLSRSGFGMPGNPYLPPSRAMSIP